MTASTIFSAVAILISLGSVYYTRRQTQLIEKEQTRKQHEDESAAEWAAKFDEAVRVVQKISTQRISDSVGRASCFIFKSEMLRQRIETYLIKQDLGREHFPARKASSDDLRMPIMQQTIQEVLDCVKKFRETDPENARKLGL